MPRVLKEDNSLKLEGRVHKYDANVGTVPLLRGGLS